MNDDTTDGTPCAYPLAPSRAELLLLGISRALSDVHALSPMVTTQLGAACEHMAAAIGHVRRAQRHIRASVQHVEPASPDEPAEHLH